MVEPICVHKRIFRKMSSPSFSRSVMPMALQLLPLPCHVLTQAPGTACMCRPWCSSSQPCPRLQIGSARALPRSLPRQSSAESNDRQSGNNPVSCSVSSQSNRCPTAPRFIGMKHFGVVDIWVVFKFYRWEPREMSDLHSHTALVHAARLPRNAT